MHQLPNNVTKYAETPIFTEETVPQKLVNLHDTKPNVWGKIVVLEGVLDYIVPGLGYETRLSNTRSDIIKPEELHKVSVVGPVKFKVEFYK